MRIIKSDLSGGYVTSLMKMLEKESTESDSIISSINNLITEINLGNLSGPGYDVVKARLEVYISLFEKRRDVSQELYGAISKALGTMESYMGSDDYLDDEELETLRFTLKSTQINLQSILGSDELTDEMKRMAWNLQDDISKLRKEIEKLEKLQPTDSKAYGNITAVQGNISNYQTMVNNVAESGVKISIV